MKYRKYKVESNIPPESFETFGETFKVFGETFQNFSKKFENINVSDDSDESENQEDKVFVTKMGKTILIRDEDVFINGKKIEENVPEKSFSDGKEHVLLALIGGVVFLVTMFILCYFNV